MRFIAFALRCIALHHSFAFKKAWFVILGCLEYKRKFSLIINYLYEVFKEHSESFLSVTVLSVIRNINLLVSLITGKYQLIYIEKALPCSFYLIGSHLSSQAVSSQVLSAVQVLTIVFGM